MDACFFLILLYITITMPRLCALGCEPTDAVVHVFPNPTKFPERFRAWVNIVGEKLNGMSDQEIYKKQRMCDKHFLFKDRNRCNRLNALAVPSLFLPGKPAGSIAVDEERRSTSNTPVHNILDASTSTAQAFETGKPAAGRFAVEEDQGSTSITQIPPEKAFETGKPAGSIAVEKDQGTTSIIQYPKKKTFENDVLSSRATVGVSISMEHNYCCQSKPILQRNGTNKFLPTLVLNELKTTRRQVKTLRRNIKKLREKALAFKGRLDNAEKVNNSAAFQRITKKMTTPAKLFTYMQFRHTAKKPKGRRFSLEEKVLSLSIFKRSPKCYTLLSRYFTLPSAKCMKRLLGDIKLEAGPNKLLFEELKKTVAEMSVDDRLCAIIFDEMSLTPQVHYDATKDKLKGFSSHNDKNIADHALVFMIKGIKANYKQPVAYYFTNNLNKNDLKQTLIDVIKHVQSTGLRIVCSICDQSTVNVSTINELVNKSKATFLRKGNEWRNDIYEVQGRKIIPLYDVPHLLKGLRNNLITKNMRYIDYEDNNKEKTVKWEYFQMLYAADKSYGELRCAQKLTEEHVNPEKIKKMRVKTAAQIFSHSVAVATEHLTARGDLPEECKELIPMVLLIDNLFDSLNVSSFHIPNGKIYKGSVKRASPHHLLWQKSIKTLKTVKYIKEKKDNNKIRLVESTVPSVKNFIKTIEGMQALWTVLNQKYSFDSLLTRNLNQDPIENFFGNIRSYGARNVAPNCIAFEGAFKALLLNNFSSPHSLQANCEQDQNQCLRTLEFYLSKKTSNATNSSSEDNNNEITFNEDLLYTDNNDASIDPGFGQRNYVCGWILRKCLKNVIKSCQECKTPLLGSKDDSSNSFIKRKEYNRKKKWLCYPSERLQKCFYELQNIIASSLKSNVKKNDLKKSIKMFTEIFIMYPFECNKHKDTLKQYFEDTTMNVIIYSWCRSINRILAGKLIYTGEDEVKTAAQLYYNKHKHFKNK